MSHSRGITVHPRTKYIIYVLDTDEFYRINSEEDLNKTITVLVSDFEISPEDAFNDFIRIYDIEKDRQITFGDFKVDLKLELDR